jgi:transposase-like protein
VCTEYFLNSPGGKIGGPGQVVEIDESKFFHRKYHRGLYREGTWVFGGVERGSGRCFLVPVAHRDAATLLPIIIDHVHPGTTVLSDEWRAYSTLPQHGYRHGTVNHSLHFRDPNTGIHTNTVEGMWSQAKRKFRRMNGTSAALFETYLQEFMWRRQFGTGEKAFCHMVHQISDLYVV